MTEPQRKEYAGIDYFKVVSAFLVVAIHTSPLTTISPTADFILTRIIARVAVPFFFMVSGFFLYSKKEDGTKTFAKLMAFVKKTAVIYGIAILFYLPLNVYKKTVIEWKYFLNFLKDIVFDGTFYHLWYLPASIMGACIAWQLLKKLKIKQAFIISLLLYIVGLFGDSYYGISERLPFLKAVYQCLFSFSDYTRNGLFFAPVFFILGALLVPQIKKLTLRACFLGFVVSIVLMLFEGLLLRNFNLQRHDSMYFMLLPCMFFLFQCLLLWKGKSLKHLRNLSMFIYLIHPAIIVVVRGFAKLSGLQEILIENSIVYFIAVSLGSFVVSIMLVLLPIINHSQRTNCIGSRDRAWVEINMDNLCHNVKVLQGVLPAECKIMAVVKANAYGHGAVPISVCLNHFGINAFAVATIDEGVNLRKKGVKGEILILGYTPAMRASVLFHYHLSQTVADAKHAAELNRFKKPIQIHIKVDTGMNRLGENYQHVSEIASIFKCKNLKITGIFTHLCVADSLEETDILFTNQQIQNFYELLDKLKAKHIDVPRIHIQSSYGVLNYPELQCDYARIGIALYGSLSTLNANTKCSLDLRPVLALKSKVALIKTIGEGESVSYGRIFIAREEMRIATVSIGYADGFPRILSNGKGYVLIRGYRVPIIGRICMDQLIVDVTNIPDIKRDDIVTLIGKDGSEKIAVEQVALNAETITNEILSRLSDSRLKRIFLSSLKY